MEEYVTKAVHDEFAKRVDEENRRQNTRLKELESAVHEIGRLTISVEKMAVNMENMTKEQAKQGERLAEIEGKPTKRWETVITSIITGLIGAAIGAAMAGIF